MDENKLLKRRRQEGGFTLVEVLISMTVMSLLIAGGVKISQEMTESYQYSLSLTEIDSSLQRISDRLWDDLKDAGAAEGDGSTTAEGQIILCHSGTTILADPGVEADMHIAHGDTVGACSDDPDPPRSIEEHMFSHVESQTTNASTLQFQTRIDFDNWSSDITYSLQPVAGEIADNGIDDDGDGVIDEQSIVRQQEERLETR